MYILKINIKTTFKINILSALEEPNRDHRTALLSWYECWIWDEVQKLMLFYEKLNRYENEHFQGTKNGTPNLFICISNQTDTKHGANMAICNPQGCVAHRCQYHVASCSLPPTHPGYQLNSNTFKTCTSLCF